MGGTPLRVVVHIGAAKTGTTYLQNVFSQNHAQLLAAGVLYPKNSITPASHNFMAFGVREPKNWPRFFKTQHPDTETAIAQFWAAWADVKQQIAESDAHTLILSGEYLFNFITEGDHPSLKTLLADISDDISLCAYIRDPASFFLSLAQQRLKGSWRMLMPGDMPLAGSLALYNEMFGKPVDVRSYSREDLIGGDIVADFLARYDIPVNPQSLSRDRAGANTSLSAESMHVLHSYRRAIYPKGNNHAYPDAFALQTILERIDRTHYPDRRPRMRKDIEALLNKPTGELVWLRDTHGLSFKSIDYDAPFFDPATFPAMTCVADMCEFDQAIANEIAARAMRVMMMQPAMQLPTWSHPAPGRGA